MKTIVQQTETDRFVEDVEVMARSPGPEMGWKGSSCRWSSGLTRRVVGWSSSWTLGRLDGS